jgi:hypothetical protein
MPLTITIEPTDRLTTIDGAPVRAWAGRTADGVPCTVFVRLVAVDRDEDATAFNQTLLEQLSPGRHVPLSMAL